MKVKRGLAGLLTAFVIVITGSPAFAAIEPHWIAISTIQPSVSVNNGTANMVINVSGYSNCTSIKITGTIQKKTLWWWDDVQTYTQTYSGTSARMSKSYSGGSGTYRVKAHVISYINGAEKDNDTVYSGEVSG